MNKNPSAKKTCIDPVETRTGGKLPEVQLEHQVAILEATPDFVGYADAKTRQILYMNQAGRKMTGLTKDEDVTKLKISDVHPEWTNQLFDKEILPTAIREGVWNGECAFRNRHGCEIPVMMVLISHKAINGEVERFSTISRDITDRKQAEAIRKSEGRFRGLADEMAVIAEIGRVIGSTLDIEEVYERFAAETQKLLLFDSLTVNLYDVQENTMCVAYVSGLDIDGRRQGDPLVLEGSLSEAVIRSRTSIRIQPASIDEIVGQFPRLSPIFQAGLRSIMCIPLVYRNEVIGVLHFRSKRSNAYTEKDLSLAERIGGQVAGAIANARLYAGLKKTEQELKESEQRYRNLFENASEAIFVAQDGKLIFLNQMTTMMLGYSREEVTAKPFIEFIHADDRDMVIDRHVRRMKGEELPQIYSFRIIHRDGNVKWAELNTVLINWEGKPATLNFLSDITERKRAEEELKLQEMQLRTILEATDDGILAVDNAGSVIKTNRRFADLWKIPSDLFEKGSDEALLTCVLGQLVDPDAFLKKVRELYASTAVDFDTILFKDGRIIERYSCPLLSDGVINGRVWSFRDVTDRKQAEKEERRNREAAEQMADEMAVIAEIGRVIGSTLDIEEVYERFAAETKKLIPFDRIAVNLHNQSGENVRVAYTSGEKIPGRCGEDLFTLKGSSCEVLTQTRAGLYSHPKNIEETNHPFPNPYSSVKAEMRSLLRVPLIYRGEVIGSLHFGSKTPDTYTDRELHLAKRIGGQVAGAIGSAQMFSDLKRMEEEIREMSLRDQMTELFNRRGFITLAEQQIRAANRAKKMMMLTFIDLDDLKGINDTLGHKVGDQVLVDAANVLRQTFRESDVIARLGGDEFAVLSIDAADINPEDFPKRLQENIDAVNARETRSYKLAMSWGMAAYNPGSPLSLDELMSSADERMYAQKKTKSNGRI